MVIDVLERDDLPFPLSLPDFQRLFPNEAACAAYLERARWSDGFVCDYCGTLGEPYRFANRPSVCRCRHCNRDTSLTAGTVMERTHTPLSVWFWAAYLVASQTPGMSAAQFQRQLGLSRYETAFQILHKLRVGMVRPDQDRIGGNPDEHVAARVEAFTTWFSSPVRSRLNSASTVAASISGGLGVTPDVFGSLWCQTAVPNRWAVSLSASLRQAPPSFPMTGAATRRLKSEQHLQAYLNEFTFRFNRRFYPFNAFRSLLGIAGDVTAPTYAELYTKKSRPTTTSSYLGS